MLKAIVSRFFTITTMPYSTLPKCSVLHRPYLLHAVLIPHSVRQYLSGRYALPLNTRLEWLNMILYTGLCFVGNTEI